MSNAKILFVGDFSRNRVQCKYRQISKRKVDRKIENAAKKIWQTKFRKAKAAGKKVWDQPVYRLEKFLLENNKCILEFSTIPFSVRSSIKDFTGQLLEKGDDYLPMAVYSSVFVETADGSFVFGEKSDKFLANRKFSYIGGVFNRKDKDKKVDLFAAAVNEVREELGINQKDIRDIKLVGALRSDSCNAAMVFHLRLNISQKEVISKFKRQNDNEMKDLFFTDSSNLKDVTVNKIGKETEFVNIFLYRTQNG
jgi:hypothetical protein